MLEKVHPQQNGARTVGKEAINDYHRCMARCQIQGELARLLLTVRRFGGDCNNENEMTYLNVIKESNWENRRSIFMAKHGTWMERQRTFNMVGMLHSRSRGTQDGHVL